MPLELIIRDGDGPERRQLVPKEAAVLGRREDNDVVLPFSFVSARHGRVFMRGGLLHVEDMGSTNGTLVNGVALEPMVARPLRPDDLVEIDRLAFWARWVDDAGPPALVSASTRSLSAPGTRAAQGAPAGVWEIQAGRLPAAPSPAPEVAARVVHSAPTAAPDSFAPSLTHERLPVTDDSGRLRVWSIGLQVVGLLAVIGGLALLLIVLLA